MNHHGRRHPIPDNAYVLIIGAMKCGTTSLFSYMSEHPLICPSFVKEPEYFSRNQRHKIYVGNYADLWKHYDSSAHRYVLEASTGYTKYPMESDVPERIRESGIDPKFIYIMRNPVDRIVSHLNFAQLGKEDRHLINVSSYYLQLERYRRYFPLRNMLFLDFDELTGNPENVLKTVYSFLDLPFCFPERYEAKNESLPVPRKYRKVIYALNRISPEPLRNMLKAVMIGGMPGQNMQVLNHQDEDYIRQELKDDMKALHDVYGIDVQKWGFVV